MLADPMVTVKVGEKNVPFLVDTGARYSTLSTKPTEAAKSHQSVEVTGFSGTPQTLPFLEPLPVMIAAQQVTHEFLQCPLNLMGRDLLIKMGASILCSPNGVIVRFPIGHSFNCSVSSPITPCKMMMSDSPMPQGADIYWGLYSRTAPRGTALSPATWPGCHRFPCSMPTIPLRTPHTALFSMIVRGRRSMQKHPP